MSFFNKTSTKKRQQKLFVDDNVNNSVDGNPEGNEEILFLRNLVSELQSEKKELHKLLDQQQRLALQDKKLLEEYKEEIKELKSLMVPVRKDNKDPMVQKSKDIDNTKEELHTKNKKWWKLWK
ncbi:hypothetical protein LLT6_13525 [Lactococcus cremoris subsp. cremoris TIFN6]|uniref:Uncharacterized protein n=1 Tax=Lactococcus cremoris subsp. cremoris TIFN6 TaxID=1234876 RepID=T0TJS7_LACLC|nr:hypothetical protein LLT6_13525 [Lactococcus cremoris subsp. cremoris TIFN6]